MKKDLHPTRALMANKEHHERIRIGGAFWVVGPYEYMHRGGLEWTGVEWGITGGTRRSGGLWVLRKKERSGSHDHPAVGVMDGTGLRVSRRLCKERNGNAGLV